MVPVEARANAGSGAALDEPITFTPSRPENTVRSSRVGPIGSWWMLAILFFFYAYTYIDRLVISLLVPDIKATVGLSDTAMGLVMGPVPTVIFALASFPAGWAADRFPRWLVLALGMTLFAAA